MDRVIAVREARNLQLEFFQRDVTDGVRSPWKLPVDVVSKSFHVITHSVRDGNRWPAAVKKIPGLAALLCRILRYSP